MSPKILNAILFVIAIALAYYALDANAVFGWGLLAVSCAWLITEYIVHKDSRCDDTMGSQYSFTRLAAYTIAMCISWISFVHAIGV